MQGTNQPVTVKREVISDDESTNGRPAVKIEKREDGSDIVSMPSFTPYAPLLPSPELIEAQQKVVDLQQQLEKKETMFQKACQEAREAKSRAERAESQLDSKRGRVKEGTTEKKVKPPLSKFDQQDLERRLAESRADTESTKAVLRQQVQETSRIRVELEKTKESEAEKDKKLRDLAKEIITLKGSIDKYKEADKNYRRLISESDEKRLVAKRQCSVLKEEMDAIRKKDEENQKIIREMKEELERVKRGGASNKESELSLEKNVLSDQLDELRRKFQDTNGVKSRMVGENYQLRAQVEELERKLNTMTIEKGVNVAYLASQLESVNAQANADRMRDGMRIDELSAKLNEYERRSMVGPPPLHYPVNQFPPGFPPPFPPHRF